jgi:Flp pilus assembly protein TadG
MRDNAMLLHSRAVVRAVINRVRTIAGADPLPEKDFSVRHELKQAGQIVVVFALMLVVIIGLVGIAIDATYAWREALRVQRAADAASLAGVVYMPGDFTTATSTANNAAGKNGFPASGITTVNVIRPSDPRELDVSITTQTPTFFSRIFGINSFSVTRLSKAVYVTPVPMGSPLAYYGVYQLCPVTGTCTSELTTTQSGGSTGVPTSSQGFFGAIEGEGSNRSTGDAFATYYNNKPTLNSQYSSDGYRYNIVAAAAGTVYIYDPIFCATANKASGGGHAGAGDHWLGPNDPTPVSTYFILWDTLNTPLAPAVWTKSAELDELNQNYIDKSATYGSTTLTDYADQGSPSGAIDCQNNNQHNKWVPLGSVAAGETYSLQVTTTTPGNVSANTGQSFENMYSIAVSGGGQVYGSGSMETYANIDSGSQEFYLAQIDRTAGAGKTIEIDLFDPGDVGSPSWMQIEPDGTPAWQPITFSYTADNGRSNGGTNCLQTYAGSGGSPPSGCGENATSGGTLYNNSWVSIMVTLPSTYGDASHPLSNGGWWKIKYIVAKASDTTTWEVSIRGNPVHLI